MMRPLKLLKDKNIMLSRVKFSFSLNPEISRENLRYVISKLNNLYNEETNLEAARLLHALSISLRFQGDKRIADNNVVRIDSLI